MQLYSLYAFLKHQQAQERRECWREIYLNYDFIFPARMVVGSLLFNSEASGPVLHVFCLWRVLSVSVESLANTAKFESTIMSIMETKR